MPLLCGEEASELLPGTALEEGFGAALQVITAEGHSHLLAVRKSLAHPWPFCPLDISLGIHSQAMKSNQNQ